MSNAAKFICTYGAKSVFGPEKFSLLVADILSGKVADQDGEIAKGLIQYYLIPFSEASRLVNFRWAKVKKPFFVKLLCSREDATDVVLDYWSSKKRSYAIEAIARNPNTNPSTFEKIAPKLSIRYFFTHKHELIPAKFASILADHHEFCFKLYAAEISESPIVLSKLATSKASWIRATAVKNPHAPEAIINRLALNDNDPGVVAAAAAKIRDETVLRDVAERLLQKYDRKIADAILSSAANLRDGVVKEAIKSIVILSQSYDTNSPV